MPPKMVTLGSKKSSNPFGAAKAPRVVLPNLNVAIPKKTDILAEANIQKTQDRNEKLNREIETKVKGQQFPRFDIERVEFCVLDADILDKLKVVNVSTRINRSPFDPLNTKRDQYTAQARKMSPNCYKNEEGKQIPAMLEGNQSVVSYEEMGTVENDRRCVTCHQTNIDCPGHLGEIKLNQAFVHPLFRDYLIKVLNCVCSSCSSLLIREEQLRQQGIDKLNGKNRLNAIFNICKEDRVICRGKNCGPKIIYKSQKQQNDTYKIKAFYKSTDKTGIPQDITDTNRIVSAISDKDSILLGFRSGSHPKQMIMESMPVIPPIARPYTIREGTPREDHLTTAYDEIIRDNYKLTAIFDEKRREGIENDLYFHISHFIDNSDDKYCRSPTEKIHGIKQRLSRKEGLIRTNIMGKRVNFCGRSVFGPDHELKFGEVAIPEEMCSVLTVPERVHTKNLDKIRKLWDERKITHFHLPNAPIRRKVTERNYSQLIDGKRIIPNIGWLVFRHMDDGDVVLVNRAPTLYKFSLVGNFVKKTPRKTIGLHMSETKMRNADFDGDEGNIHAIQTIDSRVEAMTFANTQACIPNSLKNSAMIAMYYNALTSAYIMTREPINDAKTISKFSKFPKHEVDAMKSEVILNKSQMNEAKSLLSYKKDLESFEARLRKHNINPLSGKALFSLVLPEDFQYTSGGKAGPVIIKDGILVKGRIDKSQIGGGNNTIQISIWKWYGTERASAFITDCTFITDWFIMNYGFSLGFEDICPQGDIQKGIREFKIKNITELKLKLNEVETKDPDDEMKMTPLAREFKETQIMGQLSESTMDVNKIGEETLSPENPLIIMQKSGAKGKESTTAHITGMRGQEIINNRRPAMRISGETRVLPYFDFNSKNIKARGFIAKSFLEGASPAEMYFLSESARVGGISIANSTPEAGAISHKLVKVFEDYKVCYDGSIRNASNAILQFGYLDGYDCGELVKVSSESSGSLITFINLKEAAERINAKYE